MVKSVFISSTSMDLEPYRDVVRDAILALDMRPIDMKYFGSRPGNAVDVSVNQVRQADIFIGIIAHRYGYVPAGHSKSITEIEYDTAVQMNIPRLMYIVDPAYPWNPDYIENTPHAQANLHRFKQRVEQSHVRRLFTTPTTLAQQVPIDLARMQMAESEKIRRVATTNRLSRRLIWLGVLGVILAVALVALYALLVEPSGDDDDGNQQAVTTETQIVAETCDDAPAPRLQIGDLGVISDEDTRSLNIRDGAGIDFSRIAQLEVGEVFIVLDGVVCSDGFYWYQIAYGASQAQGWIAEGTSDVYFVEPIEEETGQPTPIISQPSTENCPTVLVNEPFDGISEYTWFEGTDDNFSVQITDGAYQVTVNELLATEYATTWGSLQNLRFEDASIQASLRAQQFEADDGTRIGLWIRYQDDRNFLAFMLRSDGSYIVSRFEDEYTNVSNGWIHHSAINIGDNAVNRLRIDSVGDRFNLYINDVLVDNFEDSTWADGRIAFMGSAPFVPATFYMDDFQVCEM